MRIELLPSSIPAADTQYLVSFLVNDAVVIDAGAIGLLADLERQQRIRHVFLTHEHLDHIASLPIFLENVYSPGPDCVEVLAAADVLEFLHGDVFNGRVWPDFLQLSSPENAFLRTTVLESMVPVLRERAKNSSSARLAREATVAASARAPRPWRAPDEL